MLEIRHFSKTYTDGKRAVEDLNLTVDAGSIYGFIGHNGAGTTTTLRAVPGILDFEEGEIAIARHALPRAPSDPQRGAAFLPDTAARPDSLPVRH